MSAWAKEPLLFIQIGGMALVQAVMGVYTAFGGALTVQHVTAINGLATVTLTALARLCVVPTAQLPPGVASQIANQKAAAAAEKV